MMPFGPSRDGRSFFFTYRQFTHVTIQCFTNSGPACVLGRAASPWLRPRAPALQRPPSRASPRFVSFLITVFCASSRYLRCSPFLSLALSSFSFFLLFSFSLSLSLSRAPRLQVRRDCASVLGIRKSLLFESFRYPLVNLEDNKILWAFARWAQHAFLRCSIFFAPSLCALPWFLKLFRGAAEAAAGRGSPPPPRAGVWCVVG